MRRAWWSRVAQAIAVSGMLLSGMATAAAQERPFPELDQQLQPLKQRFNADVGKVRVLVIMDPT